MKMIAVMKKIAILICLMICIPFNGYADVVSHWRLNESSGSTAFDTMGTNNGTLTNGPVWTSGKRNGGLSFDGVDDYVNCGTDASLDISDSITVEAWIKTSNIAQNAYLVCKDQFSPRCWTLKLDSGCVRWINWDSNGNIKDVYSNSGEQSNDTWFHVVAIRDGSGSLQKLYINGVLQANTNTWSGTIRSSIDTPVRIGGLPGYYFQGTIDEVKIYNRVLSDAEINENYSLASRWRFNENSGSTAFDTMETNNGTLINGPAWTSGKWGSGLLFDGIDDYVNCGTDASLDISDSITVEAWIKTSNMAQNAYLVCKDQFSPRCWTLKLDSGRVLW
ncbi:MAG: LamG domain-containing protein, partial [bacterium]|nr:LamG domain-containing protein [bacterium]